MKITVAPSKLNSYKNVSQASINQHCAQSQTCETPKQQSFKGALVIKEGKMFDRLMKLPGNFRSTHQRLLLGATAVFMQPLFDLYNERVDEETRIVSFSRTMAKIISGTLVGVAVRQACINVSEKMCQDVPKVEGKGIKNFFKNYKRWLYPEGVSLSKRQLRSFHSTIGTFLATGVMIYTNFAIDKPLTIFLTNNINNKLKKAGILKSQEGAEPKGGN